MRPVKEEHVVSLDVLHLLLVDQDVPCLDIV